jgi:prolyl oligopeptidase
MDMLRFHRFGFGAQWTGEYGSPENPGDFAVLRGYSPLHNIRRGGVYPAVLVTTADHDDRVMPGHSLKYAAALQDAQGGPAPILIRVETRAGHGAGKPTSKAIDEWVDRLAFLGLVLQENRVFRVVPLLDIPADS